MEIKGSLEQVISETVFILACIDDKMRQKNFDENKRKVILNKMFIDAIAFNDQIGEQENDKKADVG